MKIVTMGLYMALALIKTGHRFQAGLAKKRKRKKQTACKSTSHFDTMGFDSFYSCAVAKRLILARVLGGDVVMA